MISEDPPRQTRAEIFIKTLEELRDDERERQKVRLRLQHKAQAERFMKAFRAEFDDSRRPSEWTPQSKPTGREAVRQVRDD